MFYGYHILWGDCHSYKVIRGNFNSKWVEIVRKINKIIKQYLLILEEEKKKTTFLFVFLTYLPVFLLKFRSGDLVGCGIKFYIQRVPTRHTFDRPRCPKKKKYLKTCDDDVIIMFFHVFLFFGVVGPVKSMLSGYLLDEEFNSTSNELSWLKFE